MYSPRNPLQNAAWLCLISSPWTAALGILRDFNAVKSSYDYVIAGGGLSGLVVANRLTESSNTSVLVVEYGDFEDTWNVAIPYYANSMQDPSLLFQIPSVPQRNLGNRTFGITLGATVGGGTTVNGLAVTRGDRHDYDAWEEIGNKGWGWDEMLRYFRKSSTLNAPSTATAEQFGYTFSLDGYGDGPFQASFPTWQWPDGYIMTKAWTEDLGFPMRDDGGTNGDLLGVFWKPISVDAKNVTRCSARKAYYDPAQNRPNLDILVMSYVAKVQTKDHKAEGVEVVSRSNSSAKLSVAATREVILAAGAIHTPQILQLSGIGPRELLESLDIPVVEDLPGVGANYQDHPITRGSWRFNNPNPITLQTLTTNATYFNASWDEYMANRTGPLTVAHGNSRLVVSLQNLTSDHAAMTDSLLSSLNSSAYLEYLPRYYLDKPTLLAGYRAQLSLLARSISRGAAILDFTWSGRAGAGGSLMKPLSRGTVLISSTDPHPAEAVPLLDPDALTHPFDARVAVLGFKLSRRFIASPSLAGLEPEELSPGPRAATDEELELALRQRVASPSNAHPCGTAAMMPRQLGGVVDERLRVYGVSGLRVVDASVLPVIPAGNLQATMYAVAEKAADVIRDRD
ncbi:Cyclase atC [Madurella fahalii]|uniref:Cyclase atC n=1 Tax=Madurella fahalii TaxID=1157608 RepID=A0ABQ0GQ52_9PEZI